MTKNYKFIDIIYTQFLKLAKSIKNNKKVPYLL